MKAQFFIIGTVLICVLFFSGLVFYKTGIKTTPSKDLFYVSENLKSEFPKALNLGLKEKKGSSDFFEFNKFIKNMLQEKTVKFYSFWLIAEPLGTGLNVSVGNIRKPGTVIININGDEKTISLNEEETKSAVFSNPPEEFQITLSFGNKTKTMRWVRNKVSLYCWFSLERGENAASNEIEA